MTFLHSSLTANVISDNLMSLTCTLSSCALSITPSYLQFSYFFLVSSHLSLLSDLQSCYVLLMYVELPVSICKFQSFGQQKGYFHMSISNNELQGILI